jgi:gluconokinase
VSGRYIQKWPELRQARLFLGLGDGACANVGSGCRDASLLAATVGTSAAVRVVVEAPPNADIKVRVCFFCCLLLGLLLPVLLADAVCSTVRLLPKPSL